MMRNGMSPQKACEAGIERIIEKHSDLTDLQVGFLALNKNGEYGGYSVYKGFTYAIRTADIDDYKNSEFKI